MTSLALNQQDERRLMSGIESGYTEYDTLGPGMFEAKDLLEPFRGTGRAVAKTSGLVGAAAYPVVGVYTQALDQLLGTDLTGFTEDTFRQAPQRLAQQLAPDPLTSGYVGQVLNSLFDVGVSFTGGFMLGGPSGGAALAGASTAQSSALETAGRGVDPITSFGKGVAEGLGVAVGARLPASLGPSVAKNMLLYGPGMNVMVGAATRGVVGEWLTVRGYPELAKDYRMLDTEAIAIDAILGGLFGGLGARGHSPEMVDAALVAHENVHIDVDTAPGIPKDIQSKNAHNSAVVKAASDLLNDEPVHVEPIVRDAAFTEHPQKDKVTEVIIKALDDAGFTEVSKELDDLQKELESRGLAEPTEGKTAEASADALEAAQKLNTFEYDNGRGYGDSQGYPQRKGTPIEKLFSNFADALTKEALVTFRQKMFERGMGHASGWGSSKGSSSGTYKGLRKGHEMKVTTYPVSGHVRVEMTNKDGKTVAVAGIRNGMIDSLAVPEEFKGHSFGKSMLVWLHKNKLANIYEVPDRSPGFVEAQKKAIKEVERKVEPKQKKPAKTESELQKIPATGPDGEVTNAAKAVELADEVVKKAEDDSKAFDVAVQCYLGES